MKILFLVIAALVLTGAIAAYILISQPGANLRAEYNMKRLGLKPAMDGSPVSEQDIAHLPEPVQRYMRRSGTLGKVPVTSVHVTFDTVLYSDPGSVGMTGPSHQIDIVDPPRRLFFMETKMYGLPVAVLHDYEGDKATMRVRLARLFDVVNISGPEMSKGETVTILNDLALFAPSALIGARFKWTPVDETRADVTFTNGAHTVSARLYFNAQGDLVNFTSNDRGELQKDKSLKVLPWSTPASEFTEYEGRRVPGRGDAIYHRDTGAFTYGTFKVTNVTFNQAEVP